MLLGALRIKDSTDLCKVWPIELDSECLGLASWPAASFWEMMMLLSSFSA